MPEKTPTAGGQGDPGGEGPSWQGSAGWPQGGGTHTATYGVLVSPSFVVENCQCNTSAQHSRALLSTHLINCGINKTTPSGYRVADTLPSASAY